MSNTSYTVKWSQSYVEWQAWVEQVEEDTLARSDLAEAKAVIDYIKSL